MASNRKTASGVRSALLMIVLSLGLSGCQSCRTLGERLGLVGRAVPTVESEVPQPPVVATPLQTPGPVVQEKKVSEVAERPTQPPQVEEALKTVYFDYDSSVLREDARRTLDQNVAWLKANPGVRIQIEGHCDERGTEEYNLALGQRRADAVKQYLIKSGIEESRLFTISYGKARPVDPGHNETAWAKNRRAQFSRY